MPYSSDKQRRYLHWAAEHGEVSPKVVEKFDKESKIAKMLKKNKKKKESK